MLQKYALMGVIVLTLVALIVKPVYAGFSAIITSFTGDCESATIEWEGGVSFVRITITNKTTGDTLVENVENSSHLYTLDFDEELENGTIVEVTIFQEDPFDSATYTVSGCAGDSNYTEMCDDGRANTNLCEPIAIYPIETDDGIGIDIWDTRRTGTEGELLYVPAEELASLPQNNCELGKSDDGFVTMISLGGHIVIIAGPDDENKTFIFFFEEFPGLPVTDTMFGQVIFDLPACFD